MIVDPTSIDVDFTRLIEQSDGELSGGFLPTEFDLFRGFADVEEFGMPVYPRSEWADRIRSKDNQKSWPYRMIVYPHNQGREGTCFPAGTLIRMADGSQRPIEQVNCLDDGLTAEGDARRVLKTGVRQSFEMMRLRLRGQSLVHATPEHPVLTKRG